MTFRPSNELGRGRTDSHARRILISHRLLNQECRISTQRLRISKESFRISSQVCRI